MPERPPLHQPPATSPNPDLDMASLMADAERATGLSNWGDEPFEDALQHLLDALRDEARLTEQGRQLYRLELTGYLMNRLRIREELHRHPEIVAEPIERPLFIVSLPRTGTTLLQRLLATDPANRSLLYWEAIAPAPAPRPETRNTDPRIIQAQNAIAFVQGVAPELAKIHPMQADSADECIALLANTFTFPSFHLFAHLPGYASWLRQQDLHATYAYYRRELQMLQLHIKGKRWSLKSPLHLSAMQELLTTFPDACIVQIHRDPCKVIPSFCNLIANARGIHSTAVDKERLGREILDTIGGMLTRYMKVRESADAKQFFDLHYSDLVAAPEQAVRKLYEHFDFPFPDNFDAMGAWLAANPKDKHGVHRYSLEEFGLDRETVDRTFASYRERFAIRAEE